MDERALHEKISDLEARLARLEQQLDVDRIPTEAPFVPAAAPSLSERSGSVPAEPVEPPPVLAPPPLTTSVIAQPPALPSEQPFAAAPVDDVGPATWTVPTASRSTVLPMPAASFESQVGLKWAGWAGAIIVVIGAALGLKYAYDQNWFGALSPAARLMLMSLGGFALLGAGELVYRRVGAIASAGVFAAGVAVLFVVSFAGHSYFNLYTPEMAFVLLSVVTLIGAGVAMRGKLVSIAVLSIVGGNVAPMILLVDQEEPPLTPLLMYLLMLQGVALLLAWWGRSAKWWTLRGLSFATICLWMLVPVANIDEIPGSPRGTALVFTLLYGLLFHLELVLSSLRDPLAATTREPGFAVPMPLGYRDERTARSGLGVTFSMFVTAAMTAAVLTLQWEQPPIVRGAWTIGLGICCLGLGMALPTLVRRRGPLAPPSPALPLAVGYRLQAAALVVVAVPVTVSGVWITAGWAVLAISFAIAGAALNLSVSRVAAMVLWALAVAHLSIWTLATTAFGGTSGPGATWFVVMGTPIVAYLVLAVLLVAIGHAIAALVREDWSAESAARQAHDRAEVEAMTGESSSLPPEASTGVGSEVRIHYESRTTVAARPVARVPFQVLATMVEIGAALTLVIAVTAALPTFGTTLAMLCYGWALIGAGQVVRSPALHPIGLVVLAITTFKWLVNDTFVRRDWDRQGASVYAPLYNAYAVLGAALLMTGLALFRIPLLQSATRGWIGRANALATASALRGIRTVAGFAAILVALWAITVEIEAYFNLPSLLNVGFAARSEASRTGQVAISIFWSIYALGCIVLGFMIRVAGLRYFGLGLFALTVLKVMFVDLSQVETGYRILSFIGLGLLLLGTSVLYGKLSPVLLRERDPDEPVAMQ